MLDARTRLLLGGLLTLVALNALAGGIYGFQGAEGVPVALLQGTPFSDYRMPSLILFTIVGGSSLGAAIAVFRRARNSGPAAILAGLVLIIWIVTQVGMIGYVSWLQPAFLVIAVLIVVLAIRHRGTGSQGDRRMSDTS